MLHLGSPEETQRPFTSEVNAPFRLLFEEYWGVGWGFLFCCVCLFGEYFLVDRLVWFGVFFPPPSRQPARKLDGEPGSLCVWLMCECAKSVYASVHENVRV